MERKAPEILDLDVFLPPPRVIRLTERQDRCVWGFIHGLLRFFGIQIRGRVREIDLSLVSTRTTLEIEQHFKAFVKAFEADELTVLENCMYDLMVAACKPSFPEINRAWLEMNTVPDQILEMFQFILAPLRERAEKNALEMMRLGKTMAAK